MSDDVCRHCLGVDPLTWPDGERYPTAPDRPGDREQQQAADRATAQRVLDTAPLLDLGGAIAAALADARREGEIHAWEVAQGHVAEAKAATRFLVAAARAEEAARWQAKIEALRGLVEEWSGFGEPEFHDAATALSAVLDGEQR